MRIALHKSLVLVPSKALKSLDSHSRLASCELVNLGQGLEALWKDSSPFAIVRLDLRFGAWGQNAKCHVPARSACFG